MTAAKSPHPRHRLRRLALKGVWIVFAALAFALTFFLVHGPEGPQHWSSDWLIAHFSRALEHQHPQIALVYFTERSLQDLPYTSPIDRGRLADVIGKIGGAKPKAIGLDFVFDRKTEDGKDRALVEAINKASVRVVIGALDGRTPGDSYDAAQQGEFLAKIKATPAHLYFDDRRNPLMNTDHVVRAIAPSPPNTAPGFAEALAAAGSTTLHLPSSQISWLLPPKDGTQTFLTLSAEDILASGNSALPLDTMLGGKYVIIGGNFPDRDQHLTPMSVSGAQYTGASIHAQVLAQILAQRPLYALTLYEEIVVACVSFAFGAFAGRHDIAEHHHLAVELACVAVLVLLTFISFRYYHFLFPFSFAFVGGMIGVVTGHYVRLRARAHR
jgi:adenylate cyclase